MSVIAALPVASRISLYVLMAAMGVFVLLVLWAQVGILRGRPLQNPDGSKDDWREQKIFYGIAWADLAVAVPTALAAIVLIFTVPRWGFYAMGMAAFWFLWSNVMTTATSLRFEQPRITVPWLVVFPLGSLIGLAFLIWMVVHFDAIFGS